MTLAGEEVDGRGGRGSFDRGGVSTKEAILLDHLATRREVTLQRLAERPVDEPLLVSLHTVLRDLAESGYDRRLLAPIRTVLTTDSGVARDVLSIGSFQFERKLAEALERRAGETRSSLEIKAVTLMAVSWLTTAVHVYLTEGRPSLLDCFDEVVAICTEDVGPLIYNRQTVGDVQ